MDTIRPNRLLRLLISLILLLGGVIITQAAPLRSVGLLSFEATALENAVRLDWETATELQTAGFIIKRSVNGGAFISLPDIGVPGFIDAEGNPAGFVISEGGPAEGATYQEMDNDVQAGTSYTYKLVEVENDNSEVELDTQSVTFGSAPTATATAQPSVTNTPGSPVTATATSLPSSTASSSSTPLPTPTSTSTASNGNTNGPPTTAATAPTAVPTASPTIAPTTQSETVVESAESGDEGLTSTGATTSNIVLAQAEATATAVPPIPTEATADGDTTYPGFQVPVEPTQEPVTPTPVLLEATPAYPAATRSVGEDAGGAGIPVIGSQTNNQSDNNAANSSQAASGREQQLGRIYLWAGFLLSLLVFITTVVATILLFTRKRTQ